VAVLPSLLSPGAELPYRSMALTLAGVCVSGLLWTWLATLLALRGRIIEALRNN
jgi:threonine/homoserine/homoserine lactone efflux protein